MSDGLGSLYQDLILDHAKHPHGQGVVAEWTGRSHQLNPTCGDEITLTLRAADGAIDELRWEGHGCAISQSSASFLATLAEGKSTAELRELIAEFRTAIRSRGEIELDEDRFGDAIALNGVSRYVARVKCAMLAWVALEDALPVA